MISLEQVEKLKERANVSYEDAKAALEATDGDLLDAVIYLERQGKTVKPEMGSYNTKTGGMKSDFGYLEPCGQNHGDGGYNSGKGKTYSNNCKNANGRLRYFLGKARDFIKKANNNHFEVNKDDQNIASLPVTVLIVSALLFFWVTLPVLIIGLFLGFSYRIVGPDFGKESINNVMDKAANAAESIKRSMTSETDISEEEKDSEAQDV